MTDYQPRSNKSNVPSGSMKVVNLCVQESGGAGKAAYRLHKGLQSIGVNSIMVVLNKKNNDPSIKVLPESFSSDNLSCLDVPAHESAIWRQARARWNDISKYYPDRPAGLELFTDAESEVRLDFIKEIQDADIINLHWVAGMLNYQNLPQMFRNKQVVWTLHDMNPFTGGCHYAGDCLKYTQSCGDCPQLGSNNIDDLSRHIWKQKLNAYQDVRINIVTPSRWLGECASKSSLFSDFPIDVIPNGFPVQVFKPYPKADVLRALNISPSAKIILFGADSIVNQRKGFKYLLGAIEKLSLKNDQENIIFTFGDLPEGVKVNSKYPAYSLGSIGDEKKLAIIYSAADVFVLPSLEDNLPNTVVEAMACGVPVVGFDIGGIPDMIEHKKTGYLVPPKDTAALAEGIEWVLSSNDRGENLSAQCRQKAVKQYALEIQASAYKGLYDKILNDKKMTIFDESLKKDCFEDKNASVESTVINNFNDLKSSKQSQINMFICPRSPITIATSIAPKEIFKQVKAVESWTKLGFDVVSINCKEEIEILRDQFPDVKFIQAECTAKGCYGKPLVYLDDVLKYFCESGLEYCGIVNSDIHLTSREDIIPFIKKEAKDALVYGSRVNVDSLGVLEGESYRLGFDLFFFHKSLLPYYPKSKFCIGMPWWDYWIPLVPILKLIPVKRLISLFAFHIRHPSQWNEKNYLHLGRHLFENLKKHTYDNVDSHLAGISREFWNTMCLDYEQIHLPNCISDNDKYEKTLNLYYDRAYSILDFLDTKSIPISHVKLSDSVLKQAASYNSIGNDHLAQGNIQSALKYFLMALKIAPLDRETVLNCGRILSDNGQIKSAKQLYYSYLCKNPHDNKIIFPLNSLVCNKAVNSFRELIALKRLVSAAASNVPKIQDEKKQYLVTAIVSTYNSESFIRGCLEDLEHQTIAEKLEIIVVNSGSQENEEAIVHEYQQKYDNIVYIKTEQREGIYAAWNRAVKVARGTFLTNANTDDRHRDDALEIMAEMLLANPDAALVYGDQICTDTPNYTFANHHATNMAKRPEYSFERLLFGCCVGSQPMWRKSLHTEFGYFDESLTCAGDWDFWLRVSISSKYKFKHIPEFLGLYYYNENGIEHGKKIHSLHERYIVGKRYGNPYISVIPLYASKDNPLVSVIMPAYNAAEYIAEAIESVLIQNYIKFELLIINDGSTDNTEEVVLGFNDERIRNFRQENRGLAATHNVGIKKSRGEFIIKLDSDDMMTPDFIAKHLQIFEKHPETDLIYCDDCLIDENSKPIRVIERPEYTDRKKLIRDLFHCGFPVVPFRTCIRKSIFDKIGLFDENLRIAEDYDMIRRFVKYGLKIQHLPSALYLRRMTSDSLSRNYSAQKAKCHFEVIRRFTDTFTYDELFPDVAWDKMASGIRQLHAKCLTAGTYLALGQEYIKSNALEYSRTAFDRACSELNDCIKMDPENQGLQQLLQKSKRIRARYTKAAQQAVTI